MANWIEGTVVENIHWTNNLFTLKIDADVDHFEAGQFTSLGLKVEGELIARPYSFLSSPDCRPLEFFFYTAIGGVLSNALNLLKKNDKILLKQQANGYFILDEVPAAKNLWLMGTGTGIAPYLSILNTEKSWQKFQNIILVHGVRNSEDLLYQEFIKEILQKYPERFKYQPFISRNLDEDSFFNVLKGRIPLNIENGILESSVDINLDVEDSQIMLCGNPDMVKSTLELLKIRGFKKNLRRKPGQVTTENYW